MIGYVIEVAQAALVVALAPGLVGLVRWMKARLQSRRGAQSPKTVAGRERLAALHGDRSRVPSSRGE